MVRTTRLTQSARKVEKFPSLEIAGEIEGDVMEILVWFKRLKDVVFDALSVGT